MKNENLEMIAKQLVRIRRTAGSLQKSVNELIPVLDIALQQFEPICRPCFLTHGLINECRCEPKPDVDKTERKA